MKVFIVLAALVHTFSSFAEDVSSVLKFDNPVVDCKTVSAKDAPAVVFSKIEGLSIEKYEQNNEVFADLKIAVAFGKCKNGSWNQSNGSLILTKASVERPVFKDTKFALAATYEPVDLVNDGRETAYKPHIKIGLNISVTKLLKAFANSQSNTVEVRANYWVIASGSINARYVFTKNENGDITVKSFAN